MSAQARTPHRVHLIAHANPAMKDVIRYGLAGLDEYFGFIKEHLPAPHRLTYTKRIFEIVEDQSRAGRRDDAARIRDLQNALDDPNTLAIVSASGGAYLTRILPHLDFSPLTKRTSPLWITGFSEITNLVNLIASYRGGRGLYWLCPNYLGWKIRPRKQSLAAFGEFWRNLPDVLAGRTPEEVKHVPLGPIEGRIASGKATSGRVRLVGGCLSVLVAMLAGPLAKRMRPDGAWLALEDIGEEPYRIDRHLAALKLAGWFDRVAGVLIGRFHADGEDQLSAVLEYLKYHLPADRRLPVVTTDSFGHAWPMVPVPINTPLQMHVTGRKVSIGK